MTRTLVYVGTYTGRLPHVSGRGTGIETFAFADGHLEHLASTPAADPSFLTTDRARSTLYAVNELMEYEGSAQGAISAYRVSPDGALSLLGQRGTGGTGPCHVSVDHGDRWVMVANYYGGSVAVFPRLEDGSLGERRQFIQHRGGTMTHPTRQSSAHAHLILTDPTDRFAYVPDLGLNRIVIYGLNDEDPLGSGPEPLEMAPGAGPRHFAFHPDGRHVVIINELDSTVVSAVLEGDGTLTPSAVTSTLPPAFDGESTCAEVAVSRDGPFVYASNRGHDSIAVLEFHEGKLEPVDWAPSGGRTPRHFALDPSGTWMVVANQDSDSLNVFAIGADDGIPRPTGEVVPCGTPVYVRFVEFEGTE